MKTLLELVNTVLPETGFPQLETVATNTSQIARLSLAVANREGRSLAKHNWRILVKSHTITTASSAESYTLPSGFDRFIHGTEWNDSTDTRLAGPIADEYWQADVAGLTVVTVEDRYQIRADGNTSRLFVRPVPTSSEELSFLYATKCWAISHGGQRKDEFTADNDKLLLDDFVFELGLKWRLLQAQKREFQVEFAEYNNEKKKLMANDGGMKTLRILGPVEEWTPQANVGDTGFGS